MALPLPMQSKAGKFQFQTRRKKVASKLHWTKTPTYIPAPAATQIAIFEGFFDFLTWAEMYKNKKTELNHHIIVLNSLSFLQQAIDAIGR